MKTADIVRGAGLILMVGLGMVPACADSLPTATKSCPCAAGNVCCSSGVCAASEDACAAAALGLAREAQGVWTGYLENFTFPSGSDALEITLSTAGSEMTAAIKMGADDAPPLPARWTASGGSWVDPSARGAQVREGFGYQARELRWESQRLKFTVSLGDAWAARCAAYPPLTVGDYTFYCPSTGTYASESGCSVTVGSTDTPIECTLLDRCLDVCCLCDESACVVTDAQASLDISLRGDLADGSIIFGGAPINVRLTRRER